jgi:ribosomal protein S18 acetylase RimI-like enzyme
VRAGGLHVGLQGRDRRPEDFRALWDDVTAAHAQLLTTSRTVLLPRWGGERAGLAVALRGGDGGFVVVAELGAQLIGYARVRVRRGELITWQPGRGIGEVETLSVAAAQRRLGVGRALIEAAAQELRRREIEAIQVGVWRENVAARRFYERYGFMSGPRGSLHRAC